MTELLNSPSHRIAPRALAGLALVALSNCGGEATPPANDGGTKPAAPSISGIQPAALFASSAAQTITIAGTDFESPTLVIAPPTGAEQQLSGSQLSTATRTAIAASIVLGSPGTWRAQVRNADGRLSGSFSFSVAPAAIPVVQHVAVDGCESVAGCTVSVTGSGFQPGASVILLDNGRVMGVVFGLFIEDLTASSFHFRVGAIPPFEFQLLVANTDGQVSASPFTFGSGQFPPRPVVTSVGPTPISASSTGQLITVSGSTFASALGALLISPDGSRILNAERIEPASPTSARFFVVLDTPGIWTITVNNGNRAEGSATFAVGPPDPNALPAPQITSVTPSNPTASDAEQIITLVGSGFRQGLTVNLSDTTNPLFTKRIVSVTATEVRVALRLLQSGLQGVSVRNPDYVPSNEIPLSVAARPPATVPVISSQAVAVQTSLVEQRIVLNGTGFGENMLLTITGAPDADLATGGRGFFSARFLSTTQVQLTGTFDRAGVWRLRLASGGNQSNEVQIVASYPTSPAPTIAGLDPAQPYSRRGNQTIRVNGSNFQPGLRLVVVLDDSARGTIPPNGSIDSVTPTSFLATLELSKAGRLQVQNRDGRLSNIYRFSQQSAFPTVSSPGTVVVSSALQSPRFSASFVQNGATVTLTAPNGETRSTSNVVVTDFSVTLAAVFDVVGTWRLRVRNPDGKESAELVFRVYATAPPVITGFSPVSPQTNHAPQPLTITGTAFNGITKVTLTASGSGMPPQTFAGSQITNSTPTSVQITPTLFPEGSWAVTVATSEWFSAEALFRVSGTTTPPSLSAVGPSPITKGVARLHTVTGENLHPAMVVTLTAPDGKVVSGTYWTVNVTPTSFQFYWAFDQSGTWNIRVKSADGQSSDSLTFVVP